MGLHSYYGLGDMTLLVKLCKDEVRTTQSVCLFFLSMLETLNEKM